MPYIDFVSKEDRVSLWYTTNTHQGGTSDFDPDKPVVVILHPLFLDSTWLTHQMEDPRLSSRFNLLAFDMRCSGRSNSRPSGAHDAWVDAADLAFALTALCIAPAHVFAIENLSVHAALRLAALFPETCLSLTLVNVPPPTELEWVFDFYGETLNMWCHPQDLDEFDHALVQITTCFLEKDCTPELRDELIAHWSTLYPPWRRTRIYEIFHCVLNRTPLPDTVLACITQPTLIIQADKTRVSPVKYAEVLAQKLVNVEGRARVHTIKGSPEYVTIVPTCASIVNRVFSEFVSRQTRSNPPWTNRYPTVRARKERMQEALQRLADMMGDQSIATRDPSCPLSFSCVTPEIFQNQSDVLRRQMIDEQNAFSPLGMDGRPCRRFSERQNDHWFQAEKDDEYYAQSKSDLNKEEKIKALENLVTATELSNSSTKDGDYLSAQEPVSSEVARTGRLRRSTISKHVVEKATIGDQLTSAAQSIRCSSSGRGC
ncbi:alpha beta-hydrolase [Pyrrhoderma noxium]|uniref:Alpha beta-hydrolase n=1 Tax=Pyrrhoderma noxium TaxID=2282107 RepID=A0A286UNB1_9AGAM|nr:alpha beta-hydrolase [Pyrrhoderma noxium]